MYCMIYFNIVPMLIYIYNDLPDIQVEEVKELLYSDGISNLESGISLLTSNEVSETDALTPSNSGTDILAGQPCDNISLLLLSSVLKLAMRSSCIPMISNIGIKSLYMIIKKANAYKGEKKGD